MAQTIVYVVQELTAKGWRTIGQPFDNWLEAGAEEHGLKGENPGKQYRVMTRKVGRA